MSNNAKALLSLLIINKLWRNGGKQLSGEKRDFFVLIPYFCFSPVCVIVYKKEVKITFYLSIRYENQQVSTKCFHPFSNFSHP